MKRKDFLKKTILGSALAAVGFPISRNLFGKEKSQTNTGKNGNNILEADGSTRISVQPDGNSIFLRNGKYHLMTHFENYPGVIYTTELEKKEDGSYNPKHFTRCINVLSTG